MIEGITLLCGTAASIGFLHTVLGPDHYLPFVAMSRVGGWSLAKTVIITLVCGIAHVLSSVALGVIGIAFGVALLKLEAIEGLRGDLAGWLLLTFGLVYFVWGVRRAIRNKPHAHPHAHVDGVIHAHRHVHAGGHVHVHQQTDSSASEHGPGTVRTGSMTPWVLFTIFLFGPCEPLIPLLMYPAAKGQMWHVVLVTAIFGTTTIATMVTIVVMAHATVGRMAFTRFERYGHALAGFVVLACGAAIKVGL